MVVRMSPRYVSRAANVLVKARNRWISSSSAASVNHSFNHTSSLRSSSSRNAAFLFGGGGIGFMFSTVAAATSSSSSKVKEDSSSSTNIVIPGPGDGLDEFRAKSKITVYQYRTCPFCNKVTSVLDFYKIPYECVEVNPLSKDELKFSTGYKKVPIVIYNGRQINESSQIISALIDGMRQSATSASSSSSSSSSLSILREQTPSETDSEKSAREWVDTKLIPLVSPNLYRTFGESLATFDYISENSKFSKFNATAAKWVGASVMYALTQTKLKKKYGIVDERAELYAQLNKWGNELSPSGFHGQKGPDLGDLSAYGVLRAVVLASNATAHDILQTDNTSPQFKLWFSRMRALAGQPRKELSD